MWRACRCVALSEPALGDGLGTPRGLTHAELMTASEVAALLEVPISTLLEWGRNGTLPRARQRSWTENSLGARNPVVAGSATEMRIGPRSVGLVFVLSLR
jgi:hypothetical protein